MSEEKPSDSDPGPSGADMARWLGALGVAVAAGIFYFHALGAESVCHQEAVGSVVHKLCGPPGLLDLAPFALVIAVLLWPDLGELAITGLFSLRRRVRHQEGRQEALESHVLALDQQLTQVSSVAQNQSQAATVNVYPSAQEDLKRGIDAKEATGEDQALAEAEEALVADAAERERLLGEFVREYSRLEPYVFPPSSPLSRQLDELGHEQRVQVERWREMFAEEISALRQTRNAAVHQPGLVSTETLGGAIDNTRELSRILFGQIG